MFEMKIYSHRWGYKEEGKLISVNNFWLTIRTIKKDVTTPFDKIGKKVLSEPLDKIMLSFDDENKRLKIIVQY